MAANSSLLARAWHWRSPAAASAVATAAATAAAATTVRLCSFNVLADGLAQHGGFAYCDQTDLEWPRRFPLLLAEITRMDPDIVGLAECNNSESHWLPQMKLRGYTGFAVHKAKSPAAAFGASPDGVALFWKTEKWEAVEPPLQWTDRGVVCAQLLKHCDSRQQLRVVMLHLKAGHSNSSIRQAQMSALLEVLPRDAPLVIMGDFNAEPEEPCVAAVRQTGLVLASDMPWTTWKCRDASAGEKAGWVKHTIDYIFASPSWPCVGQLQPPPDELVSERGLPCSSYPSDHISLVCDLAIPSS